jgi:hypothetical protein
MLELTIRKAQASARETTRNHWLRSKCIQLGTDSRARLPRHCSELLRRGATRTGEAFRSLQRAVVGDYDIDVLVDSCVAVEIKVAPQYDKRDEAQLLNELKATG